MIIDIIEATPFFLLQPRAVRRVNDDRAANADCMGGIGEVRRTFAHAGL